MADYEELSKELRLISEGVHHKATLLSNASALIFEKLEDLNWCGFYLNTGVRLALGPFQGKAACTAIEFGSGVCGTAAKLGQTVVVDDVHTFEGHIPCDGASNSEIVIPLTVKGILFGVLDIDSPKYSRFTEEDREGLELAARTLEELLEALGFESDLPGRENEIREKTAASLGDAALCIKLGNDYYYGEHYPQSAVKAVYWYEKAASLGNAEGECLLGYCLRKGIGCEKNEHRAFGLFALSAEKGFPMAMYNMGYCLEHGIGAEENPAVAKEWYQRAKEAGYEE